MKSLLEAGVHFGHQTRRWNPQMKRYIFTQRNGIHIIDLQQTLGLINEAYRAMVQLAADGGKVLFVGTKRQAQEVMQSRGRALRDVVRQPTVAGRDVDQLPDHPRPHQLHAGVAAEARSGLLPAIAEEGRGQAAGYSGKAGKVLHRHEGHVRSSPGAVRRGHRQRGHLHRRGHPGRGAVFAIVDTDCDPGR